MLFYSSISFAQQSDIIIGKYRLPNKLEIEIYKNKGKYFGKIIALNGFENYGSQAKRNRSSRLQIYYVEDSRMEKVIEIENIRKKNCVFKIFVFTL